MTMSERICVVQNQAQLKTSNYYDTIGVFYNWKDAMAMLETISLDMRKNIDANDHECFNADNYHLGYGNDVPDEFFKSEYGQVCFYDDEGHYDIYWIEEHIIK
jgi:hypothetical protein